MKNREEITARHWNLLSNQQHTINILMQLYNPFWRSDGTTIEVSKMNSDMSPKRIEEST